MSAVDPTEGLAISDPYELAELDRVTAAALAAGLTEALGSFGSAMQVGARYVEKGGTQTGLLFVIRMPGFPGIESEEFVDSFIQGAAGTPDAEISEQTIGGYRVVLVVAPAQTFAAWQVADAIIMVTGTSGDEMLAIAEAVIEANT